MKAINTAVMLTVALSLAACSSGKFDKGDKVIAFHAAQERSGYCEGTVISSKKGSIVVDVSDCRNGGVPGYASSGMESYEVADVYKPADGLSIIKARQDFFNDPAFNNISNSNYSHLSANDIGTMKAHAQKGQMPLWQAYLTFLQASLPILSKQGGVTFFDLKSQQAENKLYSDNIDNIKKSFVLMATTMHNATNKKLAQLLLSVANANAKAIIYPCYYDHEFIKKHPSQWEELFTKAVEMGNQIASTVINVNKKYLFVPQIPMVIAYASHEQVAKGVEATYAKAVMKIAKHIVANESESDKSNTQILNDVKKAMTPYKVGTKIAIETVSKDLAQNRVPSSTINYAYKELTRKKIWRLAFNHNEYTWYVSFGRRGRRQIFAIAYLVQHSWSPYTPSTWPVVVASDGTVTVKSQNDLQENIVMHKNEYVMNTIHSHLGPYHFPYKLTLQKTQKRKKG